jgi:hypothetical protein
MAQHQYALVRYVALDRCLSRLRLTKDELIARCSEAVSRVTGDDRRISEKTFYNDIRALREGIVLGREAPIVCTEGLYQYDEHGFSLFRIGAEEKEMKALQERLEILERRAARVLERIEACGVDKRLAAEVRAILLGEGACSWAHIADKEEKASGNIRSVKQEGRRKIEKAMIEEYGRGVLFRIGDPSPPDNLNADGLARWFLDEQGAYLPKLGIFDRIRRKIFRRKTARVTMRMVRQPNTP